MKNMTFRDVSNKKSPKAYAIGVRCQHLIGLFFIFICPNQVLAYKDPYPYSDDNIIKRDDSVTLPLTVPGGISIDGHKYSSVYASTNGIITIDHSDTTFTPPRLQDKHSSSQKPLIAVFWTDIYPNIGNSSFYYDTYIPGDSLLNRAISEVRYFTGSTSFSATWMLVVTWYDAPLYCCRTGSYETLTVQGVLVTDNINTYVIFNYMT